MAAANRIIEFTELEARDFEPKTLSELAEYAEFLGIDIEHERDLFPIAEACVVEGLPKNWVFCKVDGVDGSDDYFYFNKKSGESRWDHPLDDFYKQLVLEAREMRQCYVVSLTLLQDDAESKILGTNLAGEILVVQTTTLDQRFGDIEDKLRSAITVDEGRVLCFAIPNAKLIGFSSRSKPVEEVFKQD